MIITKLQVMVSAVQPKGAAFFSLHSTAGLWTICMLLLTIVIILSLYMKFRLQNITQPKTAASHLHRLNSRQLGILLHLKQSAKIKVLLLVATTASLSASAQPLKPTKLMNQAGSCLIFFQ